jgi:pyruvate/oxaloacetate carboxyltransferase
MYAKLDKLREDLKKAVAKRDAAEAKVKRLEEKLREEENQQIVSDVTSYNLTPEQLAQFLQLANSGKLQAMISGQIPMPVEEQQQTAGNDKDEEKEELSDDENN